MAENGPLAPLGRDLCARPSVELAPLLLGRWVVCADSEGLSGGLIVEAEAYGGPNDLASHARAGRTRRTAPMFGPPGHAYIYRVYGLHWCLNVVSDRDGEAGAVLIRALAPTRGMDLLRARRGRPADPVDRIAAGPARVCQALAIDGALDGQDLTLGERIWLADPCPLERERLIDRSVVAGPRVGVSYAGGGWAEKQWRFGIRGHPSLSRPFPEG